MAYVSVAGVDNFDLGDLDSDLFFAVYSTITLPGFPGAKTKSLGGGLTKITVTFGGQKLGAIVANYQGSASTGMTGGTIQSVLVYDSGDTTSGTEVWAKNLGISVSSLLSSMQASGAAGHFGPVAELIWSRGWTIDGDGNDNDFTFSDEVGTYGNAGVFSGNDKINGRGGNDVINLYDGNDTGKGGQGNDQLSGGKGNDLLLGGTGDDTAQGGRGNDRLEGEDGADVLSGYIGNDTLIGGDGDDQLDGGDNRDILKGGAGMDSLDGGKGDDTLKGGADGDVLTGGKGDDVLTGGGDADTFEFGDKSGHDRITDFVPGLDVIAFDGVTGVSIGTFSGGVRIEHTGGTIDLMGLAPGDIDTGDILGW
ncbi:MAG: hypothetical protein KDK10_04770 [Maritimibacter sp.]|nr:hypothetical protein [Maritimibacter sp.]